MSTMSSVRVIGLGAGRPSSENDQPNQYHSFDHKLRIEAYMYLDTEVRRAFVSVLALALLLRFCYYPAKINDLWSVYKRLATGGGE